MPAIQAVWRSGLIALLTLVVIGQSYGQFPWQKPVKRDAAEIQRIVGPIGDRDPYAAYRPIYKRLDVNGDGGVSEAEYVSRTRWPEAKARAIWRASDADGDGKVTELEYCENRRVTDEAKKIFAWLDANKDGNLTEAEAVAVTKRVFAEMDADASGGVNIPEYLAARWRWQVDIRWADKPREPTK